MATNPHTKYIQQIDLGNGNIYDIHDQEAVHSLADLAALGMSTEGIFVFKGTVGTVADLANKDKVAGHVYHVTADESEYVYTGTVWEEFGHHFLVEHTHDVTVTGTNANSTVTGTATVTGGNSTSKVTGSATVTGANAASEVSGTASIANAPKVSKSAKYSKVTTGNDTFVKSYPGATSKMVTTSVTSAGTATSVINSVTPTTGSVTGVSGSTTASKAVEGTAVNVATVDTAVTVATRASSQTTVGNANVGTAVTVATGLTGGSAPTGNPASWSASVSDKGVLSFVFSAGDNPVTSVTFPTASTTSITPAAKSETKIYAVGGTKSIVPAKANGTITPYTFTDVTVPKAATAATTVVTGVSTGTKDVATVGSAVTVATGSLASSGAGDTVMTGLGTASTASALTSATLAAGTSTDGVQTGDTVTISTQTLSGTVSGTAAAQTWTQDSGSINGTAAAQTWTQNTGSISGTAAAQVWTQKTGATGDPK